MDGFTTHIYLTGDVEVQKLFGQLPEAVQVRIITPLVRDGGKQIAELIRAGAPADSGLLKAAIGPSAVKRYGGGTVFVTAGVRRGFRRVVTADRGGKLRYRGKAFSAKHDEAKFRNPTKYLHLVTGGRDAVAASGKVLYDAYRGRVIGRRARAVPPNPFMDRAADQAKQTVASSFVEQATTRIVAEAERLGRK